MATVLVVEDDEKIGRLLTSSLRANGHTPSWQRTGSGARAAAATTSYDLVLLDLQLPDIDGVDVCRELRQRQPDCVIVMLTARRDEMDVVVGLEAGADDYLFKPFRMTELLARVRAHLRRSPPAAAPAEPVTVGDLTVDTASRRAFVGTRALTLRPKEFDLLARLIAQPGVAISREQLMADVWDEHWFGSTKTLDVHIAALRQRLGQASDSAAAGVPVITTLRRHGYRLDP
ncbi:response regulator transcription factor [Nocardioides ginsengisoli]|uniref:Response regulator transcription factor n=1 Tax=Nocardioides ginsengisoli TaxID=363868 RepID=A0ABW3VVF8_9ACTN